MARTKKEAKAKQKQISSSSSKGRSKKVTAKGKAAPKFVGSSPPGARQPVLARKPRTVGAKKELFDDAGREIADAPAEEESKGPKIEVPNRDVPAGWRSAIRHLHIM